MKEWETFLLTPTSTWLPPLVVAVLVGSLDTLGVRGLHALSKGGGLSTPFVIIRCVLRRRAEIVVGLLALRTVGGLDDVRTTVTTIVAMIATGFVAMWSVLSHALGTIVLIFAAPFRKEDIIACNACADTTFEDENVDFSLLGAVLEDKDGDYIEIPNNIF